MIYACLCAIIIPIEPVSIKGNISMILYAYTYTLIITMIMSIIPT